ncbi:1,4-alpha-glucan branching protein GlgB [Paenibacillus sp. MMO-177]|uniref:1,4-alpha-glucan branching protein GlgB n=1 Tax=Paenibacillus sp. MMO-177 TaxID=3081289 RepID=UPI0030173BE6
MIQTAPFGLLLSDLYLFNKGCSHHSYRFMGAHVMDWDGKDGVRFAVWAPHAREVRLVGQHNNWDGSGSLMERVSSTGVWVTFVPGLGEGAVYKYEIITSTGQRLLKADPYAFLAERRPQTASVVSDLYGFRWRDKKWVDSRHKRPSYSNPLMLYEVHAGSWKLKGEENFLTYEELADQLVPYAAKMGYTHIELMPINEHPFDQSWGYQITGYYAPSSRYGKPKQLMKFIDRCHAHGIGVILDWVPGHFCKDEHGLRRFDGTPIFEGNDERLAEKPLWGTLAFDFKRNEVVSFLISNAIYWMDMFHFDGLRIDAVASMINLHMDKPPELFTWNEYGGTDNLDALRFMKRLNETIFHYYPDALMIAEDSSAWPAVTSPTYLGGLGFNFKWNMGWMNDVLKYMSIDPADRSHHHHLLTFSLLYAFSENYVLPFSHDEVVHGKRSLLNKMPGSYEEKFAQLRLLYGYWIAHPGKKLLFMGSEWGQFDEWKDREPLDWMLLDYELHGKMHDYVKALNHVYTHEPSLWERDQDAYAFQWIDVNNAEQSIISFIRYGKQGFTVTVANFSRNGYTHYRLGVPQPGCYRMILNSNEVQFGGSDSQCLQKYDSEKVSWHGYNQSISINLPPLSFQLFSFAGGDHIKKGLVSWVEKRK